MYFPQGTWCDFWSKTKVVESRGQWEDVPVPALDGMAIWVRAGSMICYAQEGRERTWNEVGQVAKVELYGATERWECGDGAGGTLAAVRDDQGRWACDPGPQVVVFKLDG